MTRAVRKPWFCYKITGAGMMNLAFLGKGGGHALPLSRLLSLLYPFPHFVRR